MFSFFRPKVTGGNLISFFIPSLLFVFLLYYVIILFPLILFSSSRFSSAPFLLTPSLILQHLPSFYSSFSASWIVVLWSEYERVSWAPCHDDIWRMEVQLHTFLTSALNGRKWWTSRSDRFTPRKGPPTVFMYVCISVFRCFATFFTRGTS
jgi:hypothetical protein